MSNESTEKKLNEIIENGKPKSITIDGEKKYISIKMIEN